MNHRGHATARLDPGAFRCLVCKTYVTGTAAGHCPRCGWTPPAAVALAEARHPDRWLVALGLLVVLATMFAIR